MASPRVFEFLFVMTFTLMSATCVSGYDDIDNVMASDIGRDFFTLNWQWVIDADDEYDPWGCRIITSLISNLQVVHEVKIEGDNTSYTVSENLTHWELYRSCITPILTDGTEIIDGEESTCTDKIQTLYDPWTEEAELAVICTGGLIFMVVVAQIINFKWPRDKKRTFTLPDDENDDEDDDDKGSGKTESIRDLDNLGFEQDEDATSSVNDWNAAAAMAAVETNGGKTRGGIKQWVKHSDAQHKQMRLPDNLKDNHDVNHNNSQAQTGGQPGSHFPVDDGFKGNVVGSVEEGVPAVEVDVHHVPYQPARPNENPLHPTYQNSEPYQPAGKKSEIDELAYQNQTPYHLAYEHQEPRQPTYHDQEPNQSMYQNQQFPDDSGQGMQDDAARDHDYRNYGYEDDLDNPYGYDQRTQQYPTAGVIEDQYDTIPSVEDDLSRYM